MSSPAYKLFTKQGTKDYVGHDISFNGVLNSENCKTLYVGGWTQNWALNDNFSGFFTDQSTIDSCLNDDESLNSNIFSSKLQTKYSNWGHPDYYEPFNNVSAYDVDYDKLNSLKESNPDLYSKLTNSSGDIECGYGKVSANIQFGEGGGNQIYIDKDIFQQGIKNGVFNYNESKSFSIDDPNTKRLTSETISLYKYEYILQEKYEDASDVEKVRQETQNLEMKDYGINNGEEWVNLQKPTNENSVADCQFNYDYYSPIIENNNLKTEVENIKELNKNIEQQIEPKDPLQEAIEYEENFRKNLRAEYTPIANAEYKEAFKQINDDLGLNRPELSEEEKAQLRIQRDGLAKAKMEEIKNYYYNAIDKEVEMYHEITKDNVIYFDQRDEAIFTQIKEFYDNQPQSNIDKILENINSLPKGLNPEGKLDILRNNGIKHSSEMEPYERKAAFDKEEVIVPKFGKYDI